MKNEYPKNYEKEHVKNYIKTVNWDKRLDREIPFLTDIFQKHNCKNICDLGCGPGKHALRMAKTFNVTGIDIDDNMIAYANEQLQNQNIPNLSFMQGNFIEHSANIEQFKENFDGLYSLGNALMIIWTNSEPRTVVEILKHLSYYIKSGGSLFFQILNSDNPRHGHVVSKISQNEQGENSIQVKHFIPVDNKLYTTFSTLKWKSNEQDIKVADTRKGWLKLVPLEDLKRYLEEAGFENMTFYEDYSGKPLKKESDSLLCFAKKKSNF